MEVIQRMHDAWVAAATLYYSRNAPTCAEGKATEAGQPTPCADDYDTCSGGVHTGVARFDKDLAEFHNALTIIYDSCQKGSVEWEFRRFFSCASHLRFMLVHDAPPEQALAGMVIVLTREKNHMLAILRIVRQAVQDCDHNYGRTAVAAHACGDIMHIASIFTRDERLPRFRDVFTEVFDEACAIREMMLDIASRGILPRDVAEKWARVLSLHPMCEHSHYTHPFVPYIRAEDVEPGSSGGNDVSQHMSKFVMTAESPYDSRMIIVQDERKLVLTRGLISQITKGITKKDE